MFGKNKALIEDEAINILNQYIEKIEKVFTNEYFVSKRLVLDIDLFNTEAKELDDKIIEIEKSICSIMDVDYSKIHFMFSETNQNFKVLDGVVHSKISGSGFTGGYAEKGNSSTIFIEESLINDPIKLVATIVRELGHYRLLHEKNSCEIDSIIKDILPTYFGFGLFTSSCAVDFKRFEGIGTYGWRSSKFGNLTEYQHGYIIAKWAKLVGYSKKEIDKYLKPNVCESFRNYYEDK